MARYLLLVAVFGVVGTASDTSKPRKKDSPSLAPETIVDDLSGFYTCEGTEGDGKSYEGIVLIRKKKNAYFVQWYLEEGSTFAGVGMQDGDIFTVGWAMMTSTPTGTALTRGVNLYRVESVVKDRIRLSGKWTTLPGPGNLKMESLTFLKPLKKTVPTEEK